MKRTGISVIVINHNRYANLLNLLKGLEKGQVVPEEVVLIEMEREKSDVAQFKLNIVHRLITDINPSMLPIAKARNYGAQIASFNNLVFLDVDCIPSLHYIKKIRDLKLDNNTVYMGQPKYLSKKIIDVIQDDLDSNSVFHPHRNIITKPTVWEDYGMFWSLCFFITRELYYIVGGFDEGYLGYGAEDTDFAFKMSHHNISFCLTPFKVYHQLHKFVRPPLNNLVAIVRNSNLFYNKWNKWPMENHLERFREMNLIEWDHNRQENIEILNLPNTKQIEKFTVYDEPYA